MPRSWISVSCSALLSLAAMATATLCMVSCQSVKYGKEASAGQPSPGKQPRSFPVVRYFEGNWGSQDTFCPDQITIPVSGYWRTQHRICKNDEARSLRVENLPQGSEIEVYDNPDCNVGDDWAKITTNRSSLAPGNSYITVNSFEENGNWENYKIDYHYQDGNLDGKVSCVKYSIPPWPSK